MVHSPQTRPSLHPVLLCLCAIACGLIPARAVAQSPGEERFFAGCPRRDPVRLHHEESPWDLHGLWYTAIGVGEVEVLRMADWIIDLPLPGAPLHPCQRATKALRAGFNRLPRWRLRERVGELVDALQIPELSFADASATYSFSTGGTGGPGSGMVIRVHKLIDWTQHVTGDVNGLAGSLVGRRRGLVTWAVPARAVDGLQWLLLKTFNRAGVVLARTIDGSLTLVESAGDGVLNLGYRRPHERNTVLLRLPMRVYRAHELWLLERHAQMVVGLPEMFARATHAALAHHRRGRGLEELAETDRLRSDDAVVVVMTSERVIARAPTSLRAYIVPAAWVLNPREASGEGSPVETLRH